MVKKRAWHGAPLDSDAAASMLGDDEERRGDATMRNDHGMETLDPCRVENRDKAGRPDPVLMGVLHAETRSFVDSGDIDGLAAAMRADADGLAERLALRARGGRRMEPETHRGNAQKMAAPARGNIAQDGGDDRMDEDARIVGIDARMAQIAADRGHWPDERTPEELHAMTGTQFVSWACGVIHGAAVMAPMRSNDGRLDDLCQMAYLEASRRHPKAPLYTRAHNRCLREEGYSHMMSEEDWTLPGQNAPSGGSASAREHHI